VLNVTPLTRDSDRSCRNQGSNGWPLWNVAPYQGTMLSRRSAAAAAVAASQRSALMTMRPHINSLRAENLAGNYGPACGDYPVRLLTRRTLGLSAGEIHAARAHAPENISYAARGWTSRRPPC
jgi:hypothetical protein